MSPTTATNGASARKSAPARAPILEAPRLLQEVPGVADVVWSVLARVDTSRDPTLVAFTSAQRRAGNSVLAAATAIGLMRHARVPVCLVETNVEHPSLARYFGLPERGLSDVLDGDAMLEDCLNWPRGCPGLYVLPGGTPRRAVSGEIAGARMREILQQVGAFGRYVVLDAPCVLDHLDTRLLLREADVALLVLRADETQADLAARAHRVLLEAGVPLLGSIFNDYGLPGEFSRHDAHALTEEEISRPRRVVAEKEPAFAAPSPVVAAAPGAIVLPPDPILAQAPLASSTNGSVPADATAEQRKIAILERRIVKLTAALAQTEEALRRIAKMKNIDLGVASIYRCVQGLSDEETFVQLKKDLMKRIFQANLELKHATQ
jgi:Mrp family chromosome partitioning ATPase